MAPPAAVLEQVEAEQLVWQHMLKPEWATSIPRFSQLLDQPKSQTIEITWTLTAVLSWTRHGGCYTDPDSKWSRYRRTCHFHVGSGQAHLNHTRACCQCGYWQPLTSLMVPASTCTRPSMPYEHFITQINQAGRTGVHSNFWNGRGKSIELKSLVTLLVNTGHTILWCVCIYVYIYAIYIYLHRLMCVYIYTCIYIYMYIYTH